MKTLLALLALLTLHSQLPTLNAQWSQDPNVNLQVSTWGQYPVACTDGDGGVYIRWEANSYTTSQYIQRVNKYGYKWPQLVEVYGTQNGTGFTGKICPDDSNGVIVLFMEWNVSGIDPAYFFNRRVRVNRIDSTGQKLWGEYGVRVSMKDTSQVIREVVPDGEHGCIVAFLTFPDSLYVQRISASGQRMWGENGVFVHKIGTYGTARAVTDNFGGIVLYYWDGLTQITRFQRRNPYGMELWTIVSPSPYTLMKPDGNGGVLLSMNRYFYGENRVIVNRMNRQGELLWGLYGITLDNSAGEYSAVADIRIRGDSTIIVYWNHVVDLANDYQARIQYLTASGNFVLDSMGISPSNTPAPKRSAIGFVLSDSGNATFLFGDNRDQQPFTVYAQKLNSNGDPLWNTDDIVFSSWLVANSNVQPDLSGGLIRVGSNEPLYGIYAHQINAVGQLGSVLTSIGHKPIFRLIPFVLHQNYPNPFNPMTTIRFDLQCDGHVEIAVYNTLGQIVKELYSGLLQKGNHMVTWDGTDERGHPVSSGIYIYGLAVGHLRTNRKMILIR